MTLVDRQIVVTRAPHQAAKLADMLTAHGAKPLLFPCIDIAPPVDTAPLDDALQHLDRFDWLVLTSPNTVVALYQRSSQLNIAPSAFNHLRVAAVGKKTASFATNYLGINVDVVPDEQVAEGLAAALPNITQQRIFLPQSAIARAVLATLLAEAGAVVTRATAYHTITGTGGVSVTDVLSADAVTFTSPSTVDGFVNRVGHAFHLPAICIGSITGEAARTAGFTQVFEPDESYSLRGMLALLEAVFGEKVYDDSR